MNFSANYIKGVTAVIKEAQKLKQYKAMHLAFAIVIGVLMLPFAVTALAFAVTIYIFGSLCSVFSEPVQKLHELLKGEGRELKHASQFIIYFLSWGFIFSAYAFLSVLSVILNILYSIFAILAYICTLGGIKFHVFARNEDVSVDIEGKHNLVVLIVFVAVMGVLLVLLPLIKTIVFAADLPDGFLTFKLFFTIFGAQIMALNGWRVLFAAVYSAFVFAPMTRKKIEE